MRQSLRRLQSPHDGATEDTYIRLSGLTNVLESQTLPCSAFATRPLFSDSFCESCPTYPSSFGNVRLYSLTVAAQYVLKPLHLETRREPPALLNFLGLDFVTKSSSLVALHSWLIGIFYFTLMKSCLGVYPPECGVSSLAKSMPIVPPALDQSLFGAART